LYSEGCLWLTRLLKLESSDGKNHLAQYMENAIDQAIRQVGEEFDIY
jgi:hypothetical protein